MVSDGRVKIGFSWRSFAGNPRSSALTGIRDKAGFRITNAVLYRLS
jgi:hypothetical protein